MIDANFILLLCFIGFTANAFKIGYKKSLNVLDQKIANISETIENAQNTLMQAQEKYTQEIKYKDAIEEEIVQIIQQNHHQIEEIKHQAQLDLSILMENKSQNATARIEQMAKEITLELNTQITNKVVETLSDLFTNHLSKKTQWKINDHFLNELDKLLQKNETIEPNHSR